MSYIRLLVGVKRRTYTSSISSSISNISQIRCVSSSNNIMNRIWRSSCNPQSCIFSQPQISLQDSRFKFSPISSPILLSSSFSTIPTRKRGRKNNKKSGSTFPTKKTLRKKGQKKKEPVTKIKDLNSIISQNVISNDARATAKLFALKNALLKKEVDEGGQQMHTGKDEELSIAYIQAIKYVARTNESYCALAAEILLHEAFQRSVADNSATQSLFYDPLWLFNEEEEESTVDDNKQKMDRIRLQFMEDSINFDGNTGGAKDMDTNKTLLPPLPYKSFEQVFQAWANSKARKKGLKSEMLLYNMINMSIMYPETYPLSQYLTSKLFGLVVKSHANSTHPYSIDFMNMTTPDNNERSGIETFYDIHQKYMTNDKYMDHDSRIMFLTQILKSIKNLDNRNKYDFVTSCFDELEASIAIENADDDSTQGTVNEIDLTSTYTSVIRLYAYSKTYGSIRDTRNAFQRMVEVHKHLKQHDHDGHNSSSNGIKILMNMTANAHNLVLGSYYFHHENDKDMNRSNDEKTIEKKEEGNRLALEALEFFESLFDTDSDNNTSFSTTKANDQSYVHCLKALFLLHSDPDWIHSKSMELLKRYLNQLLMIDTDLENEEIGSTLVYNALLQQLLPNKVSPSNSRNKSHFLLLQQKMKSLKEMIEVVKEMQLISQKEIYLRNKIQPDKTTMVHVLHACSIINNNNNRSDRWNDDLNDYERETKEKILNEVRILSQRTFHQLTSSFQSPNNDKVISKGKKSSNSVSKNRQQQQQQQRLDSKSYHYMMECVANLIPENFVASDTDGDNDNLLGDASLLSSTLTSISKLLSPSKTKEEKLVELFQECCQKGLVNYHILMTFRRNVSEDRFVKICGRGQLPSSWVAGTKGVLYTDGSTKGNAPSQSNMKDKKNQFMKRKESDYKKTIYRKNKREGKTIKKLQYGD